MNKNYLLVLLMAIFSIPSFALELAPGVSKDQYGGGEIVVQPSQYPGILQIQIDGEPMSMTIYFVKATNQFFHDVEPILPYRRMVGWDESKGVPYLDESNRYKVVSDETEDHLQTLTLKNTYLASDRRRVVLMINTKTHTIEGAAFREIEPGTSTLVREGRQLLDTSGMCERSLRIY